MVYLLHVQTSLQEDSKCCWFLWVPGQILECHLSLCFTKLTVVWPVAKTFMINKTSTTVHFLVYQWATEVHSIGMLRCLCSSVDTKRQRKNQMAFLLRDGNKTFLSKMYQSNSLFHMLREPKMT